MNYYGKFLEWKTLLFIRCNAKGTVYIENMLLDRGRKIPEEISIAGFDDVPISRIVRPALTTVRQDIQAKGIAAVEELLKLIEGESEDKIVKLGTELVIRDSVKKI